MRNERIDWYYIIFMLLRYLFCYFYYCYHHPQVACHPIQDVNERVHVFEADDDRYNRNQPDTPVEQRRRKPALRDSTALDEYIFL